MTLALDHLSAYVFGGIRLLNGLVQVHLSMILVVVSGQSSHLNVLHLLHAVMSVVVADARALSCEEFLLVSG